MITRSPNSHVSHDNEDRSFGFSAFAQAIGQKLHIAQPGSNSNEHGRGSRGSEPVRSSHGSEPAERKSHGSNGGRKANGSRKGSAKTEGHHHNNCQDKVFQLLNEVQSAADGGFQSKLDAQFNETAQAVAVCQQQATKIVQGHMETLRKLLAEAGRLHMENSSLRKGLPVVSRQPSPEPHAPAPPNGPQDADAPAPSESKRSLFSDFGEDDDEDAVLGEIGSAGDKDPSGQPGMVPRGDSIGWTTIDSGLVGPCASGAVGGSESFAHVLPMAPIQQTPIGLWTSHEAPPPPIPMPSDDDGARAVPVPSTPEGAAPRLDLPGSVDAWAPVERDAGSLPPAARTESIFSVAVPSNPYGGTQMPMGGLSIPMRTSGMQAPPPVPLRMSNTGSGGDGMPVVRASGSRAKQPRHSVDSNMSNMSNGLIFEVLPVWRKSRKSAIHRLRGDHSGRINSTRGDGDDEMPNGSYIQGGLPPRTTMSFGQGKTLDIVEMEEQEEEHIHEPRFCERNFMIHPNSTPRACWDVGSLFLVSYDTITIPLLLFDMPPNPFSNFMAWLTRIAWSIDLVLTFFTGYLKSDGNVELRPTRVCWRYMTTWLLLDVIVVGIDWFEVVISSVGAAAFARIGKTGRIVRILRLIRLMRLVRMRQVLQMLTERIMSEVLVVMTDIGKSMTVILGMAHISACCWYGIGAAESETSNWVGAMPGGFEQMSMAYRYAASLHWSLTQFSGGMDEIAPQNPRERLYAISMFLLAFIVAAIFVSSLTSSMTRLLILGNQQNQQVFNLRRYLYQNNVSNELSLRIQRNATYAITERQKYMPEGAIELLGHVSEPLRMELHFELYSPVIKVHPFFERYISECPQVVRKICHQAINLAQVSHEDLIFTVGEIPTRPKVYFPMTGELEYVSMDGTVTKCSERGTKTMKDDDVRVIKDDETISIQWISEATLWTRWMHRGALQAVDDCRLCILDSTTFQDIVTEFDHPEFNPKMYAFQFVEMLNDMGLEHITDLPMRSEKVKRQSSLKDLVVTDVGNAFQLMSRVASNGQARARRSLLGRKTAEDL